MLWFIKNQWVDAFIWASIYFTFIGYEQAFSPFYIIFTFVVIASFAYIIADDKMYETSIDQYKKTPENIRKFADSYRVFSVMAEGSAICFIGHEFVGVSYVVISMVCMSAKSNHVKKYKKENA